MPEQNAPAITSILRQETHLPRLADRDTAAPSIVTTAAILSLIHISLLYNDNPEVVTLAAHLMLLAAVYQISDSIQVIGSGILRGYKDTRSIFYITFTAYWVLGLPSGYILALTDLVVEPMGPAGFWIGFIIGLTSAAIMMMLRMRCLLYTSRCV